MLVIVRFYKHAAYPINMKTIEIIAAFRKHRQWKALRLFRFMRPHMRLFLLALFFLFVSSLTGLYFPKILGEMVDAVKNQEVAQINRLGLMLMGVLVIQASFSFLRIQLFVNVSEKTLAAIRQAIYGHLIKLPMEFFMKRRVGELSSRISADISLLQDAFTSTLAELIRQVVVIVGGIILLMGTSLKLALFMLSVLPLIVVLAVFFGRFVRRFSRKVQDAVAGANTIVEETLQGILSVKVFTNEFFEMERYRNKTGEAAAIGIKSGRYRAAFSSFVILGIFGALLAVVWKGALMGLSSGMLFSFVLYSAIISSSLAGLAEVYTNFQRCIGATEHLQEILDMPVEFITKEVVIAPENYLKGNIRFNHVSFNYPSRLEFNVLEDVSFSVEANQKVALVGPSGAGKSTIVLLLLRLFDPIKGNILFDGKERKSIPLSELRSQLAIVPQDVFLFGGTIYENIAYGMPCASEEAVINAAKDANAWEFICCFPLGLNTIVGERGTQLSGGQRQRIAIARAVLKNPRILILDEATSALDAESEKLVQEALDRLMEDRTSIVIAHRLSTIRKSDKIIVLDNGAIVEEGTHNDLIKMDGGLYRNLCELQFTN